MSSFPETNVTDEIPHNKMSDDIVLEITPQTSTSQSDNVGVPKNINMRAYKCGKCVRQCTEMDGNFCDANGHDKMCKCTPLCVVECQAATFCLVWPFIGFIGLFAMCCDNSSGFYCCRSHSPQCPGCFFGGLFLKAWQGIMFVGSWFLGLGICLVATCICMRCTRTYGTNCSRKCGCNSFAKGFEDSPV